MAVYWTQFGLETHYKKQLHSHTLWVYGKNFAFKF